MREKAKRQLNVLEVYILVIYAVFLVRTVGAWSLLPSVIDSSIFSLIGVCGGLLLVKDFFDIVTKKRTWDYDVFLFLFLVVLGISILANHQYSMIGNIKVLAWQAVFLLLIYSYAKSERVSELFFDLFQWILVVFGFIMSVVSIGMFVTGYSFVYSLESKTNPLRIGFVENRLFGTYTDPNYAAVMAVIVILFSVLYFAKFKDQLAMRIFCAVNIFAQLSYIVLSGSRNGLIVLLSITVIWLFFKIFNGAKTSRGIALFAKAVVVAVIGGLLMFGCTEGMKKVYPVLVDNHRSSIAKEEEADTALTRKDVSDSDDISNLRFTIWGSAIDVFKKNILLGMPPKSLHQYAQKEMPNTYLAKTKLAVHNAYIYVLVSTGILGTVVMAIFFISKVWQVLRNLFLHRYDAPEYLYYACSVAALAISGLFHNELFLMATSSALVFWVFLSRMGHLANER